MRRIAAVSWLLPLAILFSRSGSATIQYFRIDDGAVTAPVENACPVWIREINEDDCTYNDNDAASPPTVQWIGPVFSAAYYAPGDAPPVFQSTPAPAPVTEPAREDALFVNPVVGIPIARAFISIDDRGTAAGTDDQIGGTIEFAAFERNISTGLSGRVIESFDRIIHRLAPFTVSSATANGNGGFDYVVGATPATTTSPAAPGFPGLLSGSTTSNGGFSDDFPSEIASQSSPDSADVPYWGAAAANGIASFEGATRLIGTTTSATAWGYSCNAGLDSCTTNGLLGGSNGQAALENVLLRFSTDSSGNLTAAEAFLVNYSDLSTTVTGNDSWQATTLSFTGAQTQVPMGFDDRVALRSGVDVNVSAEVLLNDLPGVAPVTVEIVTQPADGTAAVLTTAPDTNKIRYTPAIANPPDSEQVIEYQITDANSATANAFLHILVSDPVLCVSDSIDADRNTSETVDVLANDSGFNVAPVILVITGVSSGSAVVNADRTITFTPPPDEGGLFTIGYRISDGAGSATCQLRIQIDDIPEAIPDSYDVEDHVATTFDVVDNDDGVFDSPLTLEVTVNPVHGNYFIIQAVESRTPRIRYTSTAGYLGADSLSYRLTDSDGDVSNEATVTLNISDSVPEAVDDSTEDNPPAPLVAEDAVEKIIDVLANDEKLADAPFVVTITTAPANGTATVVPAAGNVGAYVKYTSTAGFEGDDTFSYTVTDADGDVSGTSATVTVSVSDSVPGADDDTFNGSARAFAAMHVQMGDTVTGDWPITIEITQQPTLGTARVTTTGSGATAVQDIEYRSNPGSAGPDTVKYRLRDADGSVSGEATVAITVADDTPMAVDDATYAIEDGTATTLRVLDNDTGTGNRLLTITITQQPSNGSLSIVAGTATSNPTVTYTPDGGFTGADTFRYSLRDADGDTSPADAIVSMAVNDSVPQATDETRNGSSREPIEIDVLLNDTLVDLPVTLQITQQPVNGTADLVSIARFNGTTWPGISYASNVGSAGTDTVIYTVTDRDGDSDEGTLTLTIVNDIPVAENDSGADADDGLIVNAQSGQDVVIEQLKTQFDVLHNDDQYDNSPLTLAITQQPANGTAIIESIEDTGYSRPMISYQGDAGYVGPDGFAYTVTDGDGDVSNEATVSFEIISFPTATYDGAPTPFRTNQEMPMTINVLDNDGGLAYGPVTVAIVGDAVHGTAVVNPDNTITFTPEPGFTGRFESPECPPTTCFSSEGGYFQYSITDSFNQHAEGYAFVDVFPGPVVDSGGSSSLDAEILALLAAGGALRRRRRTPLVHDHGRSQHACWTA